MNYSSHHLCHSLPGRSKRTSFSDLNGNDDNNNTNKRYTDYDDDDTITLIMID